MRLAVHSTHEAAEKIAGIGAVLDGILPQPSYNAAFPRTLLAGPYAFPSGSHPLKEVLFDSADATAPGGALTAEVRQGLKAVADGFNTRVVFGRRNVGSKGAEARVDVLLVSPDGIRQSKLDAFRHAVREQFHFDLSVYEDNYPATEAASDSSLERILRHYDDLRQGKGHAGYPPSTPPEAPLLDHRGRTFYGGVPFASARGTDPRAVFPAIRALDSFAGFDKTNGFLVELEFYFYAASPLWRATRILIERLYHPSDLTLFSHDWLGVPLFWAMKIDPLPGRLGSPTTVYFAHEARIARMLVEGTINDKVDSLRVRCHPDGHDASFYAYLSKIGSAEPPLGLDAAFPEVRCPWGGRAFDDIYYHVLNRQASQFDRVVAVGLNVKRETELILRGGTRQPPVFLCPNGVPDFTVGTQDVGWKGPEDILRAKLENQRAARARIVDFARARFGLEPDVIVTAVNRCELSKAPWRNVDFFRAFVEAQENRDRKALFIWLSRPKPLPTAERLASWSQWGWPLEHRTQDEGGDLRKEEEVLWEMIRRCNARGEGRYRMLYINQFGWSREKLGALDPERTTFLDLRLGTDVEIGLSIYEPFGIAPLEPFSSGTVCVLSDASGCALHLAELQRRGFVSDECFVIGKFTDVTRDPSEVDLNRLSEVETKAYAEMVWELGRKLAKPREERLRAAQQVMPHLSWATATRYLLDAMEMRTGGG